MTISEAWQWGCEQLRAADISSDSLDSRLLLEHVTGHDSIWLLSHEDENLLVAEETTYRQLIRKRKARIPLVHLTNQREFYGLDFRVTADVLTPRVETEKVVEYALELALQKAKVLDIGTGCGAIAIALAKQRPDLAVTATDISPAALEIARHNAMFHRTQVSFLQSNLLDDIDGQYDVITANLPYLTDDAELMPEVTHEPAIALRGGYDGLELYRQFFSQVTPHLKPHGYVITESDPWQHQSMIELAKKSGLSMVRSDNYFVLVFGLKKAKA